MFTLVAVRFRDSTFEETLIDLKEESTTRKALSLLRTLWTLKIILIDTEILNMINEKAVTEILMLEIKIETREIELIGTEIETERVKIGIEIESRIEVEIEEITNIESENIIEIKIKIENAKEAERETIDTNGAENQVLIEALHTKDTKINTLLIKT